MTHLPLDPTSLVNGSQYPLSTAAERVCALGHFSKVLSCQIYTSSFQDLQGRICLGGSILNFVLDTLDVSHICCSQRSLPWERKQNGCFHPSFHCILSCSPSLHCFSLDGLRVAASGLPWGWLYVPNEYSNFI